MKTKTLLLIAALFIGSIQAMAQENSREMNANYQFRNIQTSVSKELATVTECTDANKINIVFAEDGLWMIHIKSLDNRTMYFERIYTKGKRFQPDLSELPADIYLLEIVQRDGSHQLVELVKLTD